MRFLTLVFLGLWVGSAAAQGGDPARAKKLTVEEATELLKRPNSLRVEVVNLSPEVAAVLARYKGELRFEALTTLSPETAAAMAGKQPPSRGQSQSITRMNLTEHQRDRPRNEISHNRPPRKECS